MNILLISPYSDIASLGLRTIAAVMKQEGHAVTCAFLPNTPQEEQQHQDHEHRYPEGVLRSLGELAQAADVIGITLMTNYLFRVRRICAFLRSVTPAPIVWGGIHPTIRPADARNHADYCIIGEGEGAFSDLVARIGAGEDGASVGNVATWRDGKLVVNACRPLVQELDKLPFPDYGPDGHYIWDRDAGGLVPMTMALLEKHLGFGPISRIRGEVTYQTMATRGCPHRCAYCCNDVLQELYQGQQHLRRRSEENVIAELKEVKARYPFIQAVGFSDDSFFAAGDAAIERFAERYKREIGLPFFCLGSPLTITERKLTALLDAGMFGLQMGVQSGSSYIQKLYNRPIPNEKVLEAVKLLNKYSHRMVPPSYDFIIDSPWESLDDIIATLQLVRQFPRPYRLQLFSLVLFPETALYHKARAEHLISDTGEEMYSKEYHLRKSSYANLVLGAYRYPIWKPLLDFLSHPLMVRIFNRPSLNHLYALLYRLARWLNRRVLKNR